jgi:hypothetical protein
MTISAVDIRRSNWRPWVEMQEGESMMSKDGPRPSNSRHSDTRADRLLLLRKILVARCVHVFNRPK